jgi:hypothetical protein
MRQHSVRILLLSQILTLCLVSLTRITAAQATPLPPA